MKEMFKAYTMHTAKLDNPMAYAQALQCLPNWRRKKVEGIRFEQDKKLSVAAGLLLRQGLLDYCIDGETVHVGIGAFGKPYFPETQHIQFNLSHSGEMAMAVFSEFAVGCDIEKIKPINERVAERFFCSEELSWMNKGRQSPESSVCPYDREREKTAEDEGPESRFYRLWTLKESFIKAIGTGLRLPLNSFCFHMEEGEAPQIVFLKEESRVYAKGKPQFTEYAFDGYKGAVCLIKEP